METTTAPETAPRTPVDCATALDATATEINLMDMGSRLEFIQAMKKGPATLLDAGEQWRNIEGVIAFFRDHEMGAPGTWVSYVNAGVLEGIERGIALALSRSTDDFGNPGAVQWATYLTQLHSKELTTRNVHDTAWSMAKEVSTDYGIALAEKTYGLAPTEVERRFLVFAQFYNWAMRNRPVLDLLVTYAGLFDTRLRNIPPEFVDWFTNVGDAGTARTGCEIAYTIAQMEPAPSSLTMLNLVLPQLPKLLDAYRNR